MRLIMFFFINRLSISLLTVNSFCDLASLYYITFIESLAISSSEALCFDSEEFKNTSINKLIETKPVDPFLLFEEHFFASVLIYRKSNGVQFEDLTNEDLSFFT
jgi:hypothetical protein